MSLRDHFLAPGAWPLLLLVPLAAFALVALERQRARRLRELAGPRARALADEVAHGRRRLRDLLAVLGLLLALAAILQPTWGGEARTLAPRVDLVVGLDVSRSMLARDLAPNRLERARREIAELAANAGGDRLALVLFAGEARLEVPLTSDMASFRELLELADEQSVARGGSDLGAALDAALAALPRAGTAGAGEGAGAVVLLTDGEEPVGAELGRRGLRAAEKLRDRGIAVHCVGLGSRRGSKIAIAREGDAQGAARGGEAFLRDRSGAEVVSAMDESALRRIAELTGGSFVDAATTPHALAALHEGAIRRNARPTPQQLQEHARERARSNRFQWPLLAALLAWLAAAALCDRRRPRGAQAPDVARSARSAPAATVRSMGAVRSSALLGLLLLAAGDEFAAGVRAWQEGRFADAFTAFAAAEARAEREEVATGGASAELLLDEALAALRAGKLLEAAAAAERAATRGGPEFAARRDFLLGNVAFARCEISEAGADLPDLAAAALERALADAAHARDAWIRAAMARDDWPAARRNVERALRKLDELRRRKAEFESNPDANRRKLREPELKPAPEPQRGPVTSQPSTLAPQEIELPIEEVRRLIERLEPKEQEKRAVRRARRHVRSADVERDW